MIFDCRVYGISIYPSYCERCCSLVETCKEYKEEVARVADRI